MPILLYKKIGETPLEALNRLRIESPDLKNERLSYAGRLDPLAEGLLLVLSGDECNEDRRQAFLNTEKEYEVGVLLGFSTDSYDLLGIPVKSDLIKITESFNPSDLKSRTEKLILEFIGVLHGLKYPPFSSKTIGGRPLFELARSENGLPEKFPDIKGSIKNIEILDVKSISTLDLKSHIHSVISMVKGDFRQKETLAAWDIVLESVPKDVFWPILRLSVKCESGVYMRSLAESLGKKLGTSGLAFSIKRTKIGDYLL